MGISQAKFPNLAGTQVLENIRKACRLDEYTFHLGPQPANCETNEVLLCFFPPEFHSAMKFHQIKVKVWSLPLNTLNVFARKLNCLVQP